MILKNLLFGVKVQGYDAQKTVLVWVIYTLVSAGFFCRDVRGEIVCSL